MRIRIIGCGRIALLLWALAGAAGAEPAAGAAAGIAAQYPRDAGIAKDPAVLFAEDFEEKTVADVSARWTETHNGDGMSLDTDVPKDAAPGSHSIRMTSIGGQTDGGHLYKRLNPGVKDKLYLRFYLKYAPGGKYHHSGGGIGGYNPPTNYSQGQSGIRPTGDDRISVRAERVSNEPSRFDYYTYWMEMRGNPADASYWGNHFINDPLVAVPDGIWTCVEYMVKLNNPVSSHNGEAAMWIDGKEVSHLGPGFPKGKWTWDNFKPDSSGQPFEGFRWRKDSALVLNWFRISHYVSQDPSGYRGKMWYDQVVAATERIGCLATGTGTTGLGSPDGAAESAARGRPGSLESAARRAPDGSVHAAFASEALAAEATLEILDPSGRALPGWTLRREGAGLIAEPPAGAGRMRLVIAVVSRRGQALSRKALVAGGAPAP
jgi:hypothetical protein